MTEAIQTVSELSPLAAIVVIAGLAATIITQVAKRPGMTKGRAQLLAAGVSVVLGAAAYIVSGIAGVFPASVVEVVSTGVIVIAAVALTSRAAYSIVGRAIPDGREGLTAEQGAGGVYVARAEGYSADEVRAKIDKLQERTEALNTHRGDDADA